MSINLTKWIRPDHGNYSYQEDKILLHQFLKSKSTKGLSIYPSIYLWLILKNKYDFHRSNDEP